MNINIVEKQCRIHFARGISCLAENKYVDASEHFKRAYEKNKDKVETLVLYVLIRFFISKNIKNIFYLKKIPKKIGYSPLRMTKPEVEVIKEFVNSNEAIAFLIKIKNPVIDKEIEYVLFILLKIFGRYSYESDITSVLNEVLKHYENSMYVNHFAGYYYYKRKSAKLIKVTYHLEKYFNLAKIKIEESEIFGSAILKLIDANLKIQKVKTAENLLYYFENQAKENLHGFRLKTQKVLNIKLKIRGLKTTFNKRKTELIEKISNAGPGELNFTDDIKNRIINLNEFGLEVCDYLRENKKIPKSEISYLTGVIYSSLGNYRSAVQSFKEAHKLNNLNYKALLKSAYCYKKAGMVDVSYNQIKRIIEMNLPNDKIADAYASIGYFYLNNDDKDNAKVYLRAALGHYCRKTLKLEIAKEYLKINDIETSISIIRDIVSEISIDDEDSFWPQLLTYIANIFLSNNLKKEVLAFYYFDSKTEIWESVYCSNKDKLTYYKKYEDQIDTLKHSELYRIDNSRVFIPYIIKSIREKPLAALIIELPYNIKDNFEVIENRIKMSEIRKKSDNIAKKMQEIILNERQFFNYNKFIDKLADPFQIDSEMDLIDEAIVGLRTRQSLLSPTFYKIVNSERLIDFKSVAPRDSSALPNFKIEFPPETHIGTVLAGIAHGDNNPKSLDINEIEKQNIINLMKKMSSSSDDKLFEEYRLIIEGINSIQFMPVIAKDSKEIFELHGIIALAYRGKSPFSIDTLRQIQAAISSELLIIRKSRIFRHSFHSTLWHSVGTSTASILTSSFRLKKRLRKTEIEKGALLNTIDKNAEDIALGLQKIKASSGFLFNSKPKFKKINLNEFMYEICDNVKYWFEREKKEFRYKSLKRAKTYCYIDQGSFKHAIENLIRNSYDATKNKDITTVIIHSRKSKKWIKISIIDSGKGIPKDKINKALTREFSTKPNGLGIGLNIANDIVKAHHGKLLIHIPRSKGCVVTIYLPKEMDRYKNET